MGRDIKIEARPRIHLLRFSLLLAIGSALAGSSAPSSLFPLYKGLFGLGNFSLTAIFAAYSIGVLGSLIATSRISSTALRFKIQAGLVLVILGAIVMMAAAGASFLLFGRLLAGIGTGSLISAANMALMSVDAKQDSRRVAIQAAIAFTFGCMLGPLVSGLAVRFNAWPQQLPYFMVALFAAISAAGLIFAKDMDLQAPPIAAVERRPGLDQRGLNLRQASMSMLISWAVGGAFVALTPSVMQIELRVGNPIFYSLAVSGFQLVASLGQATVRVMTPRATVKAGIAATAIALLASILALDAQSVAVFIAAVICAGYGYGAMFAGSVASGGEKGDAIESGKRAATLFVWGYAGMTGPVLAVGLFGDIVNLGVSFCAFSLLSIVALILLYVGIGQGRRPTSMLEGQTRMKSDCCL